MARPGLTGHRKFRRLARALGSQIMARGVLELLWDSCYDSGEDYVGTADDIEMMVGWAGERGALAAALVDAGMPEGQGFIEPIDDGAHGPVRFRVHDLWHHAPDYVAKRRRRELDRLAKVDPATERRGPDRRTAPNGGQRPQISDCQIEVDGTPSPSPSPTRSPSPGAKGVSSAAAAPPAEPAGPALLSFPVSGKGGPEWHLTAAQVGEWTELYPGLDVLGECRKALAWVKSKNGHHKTAGGMRTFLVNWFNRSINSGRGRLPAEPASKKPGLTGPISTDKQALYDAGVIR